jgi:ubiquinone/menaquinone biosynthesis C-methylase UbiE
MHVHQVRPFYDALYDFLDYRAAVEQLREVIQTRAPQAATLLDVACGTGQHLQHFQEFYVDRHHNRQPRGTT